ncbi:MAG TPA: phospholipase D family protein [Xanthomonadales bacterium]|nr:phospholipase D family protein [Xanthomonadales bacterium]
MNRALAIIGIVLLLPACSLSPTRVQQVDATVEKAREGALTCPAENRDACSENSPLLALAEEDVRTGSHHVTLLETGEDALKIRIHLARAAKRSIDMQNFILRRDDSGELLLNELVNAARRGVRVRLLLDQMFTVSDLKYLVKLTMAHANFEIRFYNPSFHKAQTNNHDWISGVACCFRRFNQRMHNKLLLVDELVGVIGGRNLADRYFDYDTSYDFKDRDVAVFGITGQEMRAYFELFWAGKKSVPVQHLRDVARELLNGASTQLEAYHPPARMLPLLEQITHEQHIRDLFIDPSFKVEKLAYYSDLPRKIARAEDDIEKDVTPELLKVLLEARRSVVIQSPYMVLSRQVRELFRDLRLRNPAIELVFSTNSLASTDADTVYANTHKHKKRYVEKLGFRMHEFKPFPLDAPEFFPRWPQLLAEKARGITSNSVVTGDNSTIPMPAPRVGLHAKSFVVDGQVAMIGSHNFDPRSEGFNTENGLIVWDAAFARALEANIRRDIEPRNSWVVAMKPDDTTSARHHHESNGNFIPKYDSHFYGSTSVFELIPGKKPVPPGSTDFYQNHYSVGSFPEVIKTRRQINVLFLGSFFGFLEPIL